MGKGVNEPIQGMRQIVANLHQLGLDLLEVMEKQTEAIIAANDDEIEQYTQSYIDLRGRFNEEQKLFADQLRDLLNVEEGTAEKLKMDQLKKLFPDAAPDIEEWKQLLFRQSQQLKQRQERLVELLEFALTRNTELMHSIYSLNNSQNSHYSSGGRKEENSSGMAVNKEA